VVGVAKIGDGLELDRTGETPVSLSRKVSMTTRGKFEVRVKRVYEELSPETGVSFLVDGLWPRGVQKKALSSVEWVREIAPSANLRKWYGHDPKKWKEFQKRYRLELNKNSAAWKPFLEAMGKGGVTLLTATREVEISHAVVLRDFLKEKIAA
jgi:uncharacterized protein YeaO (DUF488 family)